MSGPQARPQREAAHGRRMASSQPGDQMGGGQGVRCEAWTSRAVVAAASRAQGLGRDSGRCAPRGQSGRAWPGLQGSSARLRLRKWEWS